MKMQKVGPQEPGWVSDNKTLKKEEQFCIMEDNQFEVPRESNKESKKKGTGERHNRHQPGKQ